ncbi:hypothetical protein B0H16DRAFT_235605 [Mycena metata]|uniref:Uncharacterized protein n=1 Tax=Mycena metata TaxID=1033252 RepID=A0AAD7JQR3_9AGAR|nr:hypothetical protein B0H16DRAFT_235605 [Mycena metata]
MIHGRSPAPRRARVFTSAFSRPCSPRSAPSWMLRGHRLHTFRIPLLDPAIALYRLLGPKAYSRRDENDEVEEVQKSTADTRLPRDSGTRSHRLDARTRAPSARYGYDRIRFKDRRCGVCIFGLPTPASTDRPPGVHKSSAARSQIVRCSLPSRSLPAPALQHTPHYLFPASYSSYSSASLRSTSPLMRLSLGALCVHKSVTASIPALLSSAILLLVLVPVFANRHYPAYRRHGSEDVDDASSLLAVVTGDERDSPRRCPLSTRRPRTARSVSCTRPVPVRGSPSFKVPRGVTSSSPPRPTCASPFRAQYTISHASTTREVYPGG